MLGETLSDPEGVEAGGKIKGMGLLPMDTVFAGKKTRTRVKGTFEQVEGPLSGLTGVSLEGYEIHMGVSTLREGSNAKTLTKISNFAAEKENNGQVSDGAQLGNVYGTYVHSCFDKEGVAREIVMAIARSKGLDTEAISGVDYQEFKETQYDILADALRKHLDIKRIYEIMEEGIDV